MSSAIAAAVAPAHLRDAISGMDSGIVDPVRRQTLLEQSFQMRSGREKPGRFWRIDLETLSFEGVEPASYHQPHITAPAVPGLIACDLATAARDHRDLFERAFGSAVQAESGKFSSLALALCNSGAFIYLPADLAVDEPVEIVYDAKNAIFPYTLVFAEHGANLSVVERLAGSSASLMCGISEIVPQENAIVTYAVEQQLPEDSRVIYTRAARLAKDATVTLCVAEIGAALSVGSLDAAIDAPGAQAGLNALFFPRNDQHVDLVSTVDHHIGESQSETIVKSAATGRGQARYLGNIRIAPHAQGTEAALRDDALLLSARAHIDSVPALEIAANDVKAYHGATVGALDEEQIFYMTTRGIERDAAEKMIALGFFEPVIERFPTHALRERLRTALQAKVAR